MLLSLCSIGINSVDISLNEKIDSELKNKILSSKNSELISVCVWIEDIDYDAVNRETYEITGVSQESLAIESTSIMQNAINQNQFCPLTTAQINSPTWENASNLIEYLNETAVQRQRLSEKADAFVTAKRSISRDEYAKNNGSFVNEFLTNSVVLYESKYAPLIMCKMSIGDIKKVQKSTRVTRISAMDEYGFEDLGGLEISVPAIRGDYVKSQGYLGAYVKIGQIETRVPDVDSSVLANANIVVRSDVIESNDHATLVADIIVGNDGMAPAATLYSTSVKYYASTDSFDTSAVVDIAAEYENIEWLISQGVTIINRSMGHTPTNNTYSNFCKWIDHVVDQHNVTFVQAVGNDGQYGYKSIHSYNAIIVGGIDDNGTIDTSDDSYFSYTSCNPSDIRKMDVVAPAAGFSISETNVSGTSFAAPHVTGTIAQMMCAVPDMKLRPDAIKAALMASCDRKTVSGDSTSVITDKEGAGVINALNAVNSLSRISLQGTYYSNSGSDITFTFYPLTTGYKNIAVSWLITTATSGDNHSSVTVQTLSQYSLEVVDPYGNTVGGAVISADGNSSIYFRFNATSTAAYTIKVRRVSGNTTDKITIANFR